MMYKFILQFLENENSKKEVEIKTLKDVALLLNIEYHQARQLYLFEKKQVKRAHPFLLELAKRYRIIDNPNLLPPITPPQKVLIEY